MFSSLSRAVPSTVKAAVEATAFPASDPMSAKVGIVYTYRGLEVEFEFTEGQVRPYTTPSGKKGGTPMPCAYGFIPGAIDHDGEEIDVYFAQSNFVDSDIAYVIDQYNPETKAFDEHKLFFGFGSEASVRDTYNAALGGTGLKRIGAITQTTIQYLLTWKNSPGVKSPFSQQNALQPTEDTTKSAAALPERARAHFIDLPKLGAAPFVTTQVDPKTKAIRMNLNIMTPFRSVAWGKTVEVVLQFLDRAVDGDRLVIVLASPGGEVTLASRLVAGIRKSKARITTVAVGGVSSAASMVWCEGDDLYVAPATYIMQHMSSHADQGYTASIERNARAIGEYVRTVMLGRALEIGLLTESDLSDMVDSNRDVFLSADEVVRRTNANYIRSWSDVD